jgi:hypothetical protein
LGEGIAAALDDADGDEVVGAEIKTIAGASRHRHSAVYRIWAEGGARDLFSSGAPVEGGLSWEKVLYGKIPPPAGGYALFDVKIGSDTYRALWQRTKTRRGAVNIVIAQNRHYTDHEIDEYLRTLIWVGAAAVPVAVAAVLFLVWWGLRPIRQTARAMLGVTASNVGDVKLSADRAPIELAPFVQAVADMLARLNETLQRQKRFVADASHELRTPLAIMRTEVDVTLADPQATGDDLRRMADTVRAAIVRSEDVIDRLLVLAESERLVDTETLDLGALAAEVVRRRTPAAEARGLTFALALEPTPVEGDRALLERLIDNLVGNAVSYASPDSLVRVDTGRRPDGAVLRIANSGEVIGPDELPHLFERFYRRGTSRGRDSGGSGLGLAIVAAVADVHGGSYAAQAPAEGGLVVTVTLPVSARAEPAQR